MRIENLDLAIKEICPIDGINSNGEISFKPNATPEQKKAAAEMMSLNLPTLNFSEQILPQTLVQQILASPADLEALKKALGL